MKFDAVTIKNFRNFEDITIFLFFDLLIHQYASLNRKSAMCIVMIPS